MTAPPGSFDVIALKSDLQGEERARASTNLAELLKISGEEAEAILAAERTPIKRAVPATEAKVLHQMLIDMGVQSTWHAAQEADTNGHEGPRLELVPIEEARKEAFTLPCPSCGYEHTYGSDKAKPESCEQCGVVFHKFEKVSNIKAEKEKIRRQMLERQELAKEQETARQRQREEQQRRELLEQEVARELKLRQKAWYMPTLSGGVLFLLGLGLGAAGMHFLSPSAQPAAAASTIAQSARQVNRDAINRIDPALLAHIDTATAANAVAATAPAKRAPEPPAPLLETMRQDLQRDREWNGYLESKVLSIGSQGAYRDAIRQAAQIRDLRERYAAVVRLAEKLRADGKISEAQDLLDWLELSVEKEPGANLAKVSALTEIGLRQPNPAATLNKAGAFADTLKPPRERTEGYAEVAAARTLTGDRDGGRAAFDQANQSLREIKEPDAKVAALTRLAGNYARSGSRGGALMLLDDATRVSIGLHGPERRAALVSIAEAYGELGDLPALLTAAGKPEVAPERDSMLLAFASRQLALGHYGGALQAAETIADPAQRARSFGRTALALAQQPRFRDYAGIAQARASDAAAAVASPAERAAVLSELARYAARGDNRSAADRYFSAASTQLGNVADPAQRDAALAIIAGNEARALRLGEADRKADAIANPLLADAVRTELKDVRNALNVPPEATPAPTAGPAPR